MVGVDAPGWGEAAPGRLRGDAPGWGRPLLEGYGGDAPD